MTVLDRPQVPNTVQWQKDDDEITKKLVFNEMNTYNISLKTVQLYANELEVEVHGKKLF